MSKGKLSPEGEIIALDQSALDACCIQSKPLLLLNSQLRQLRAALFFYQTNNPAPSRVAVTAIV